MYTGTKLIKPVDVLIFEGILALYDENIKDMANIKIYIDVPDDERLIRRLKRDLKSRGSDVDKTISA
jgi:uridine kinase